MDGLWNCLISDDFSLEHSLKRFCNISRCLHIQQTVSFQQIHNGTCDPPAHPVGNTMPSLSTPTALAVFALSLYPICNLSWKKNSELPFAVRNLQGLLPPHIVSWTSSAKMFLVTGCRVSSFQYTLHLWNFYWTKTNVAADQVRQWINVPTNVKGIKKNRGRKENWGRQTIWRWSRNIRQTACSWWGSGD